MTKKLFALVSDGGDGSSSIYFTFNEGFIEQRQKRYDADVYENGDLGVDGDGFHYDTLTVPDECTLESLGIHHDAAVDFVEEEDEEEEDG